MTNCALSYMQSAGDKPWVMHLSYVKPHWPYVAPAPYHAMYTPQQCLPVRRTEHEKEHAHPVVQAIASKRKVSVSPATNVWRGCVRLIRD